MARALDRRFEHSLQAGARLRRDGPRGTDGRFFAIEEGEGNRVQRLPGGNVGQAWSIDGQPPALRKVKGPGVASVESGHLHG